MFQFFVQRIFSLMGTRRSPIRIPGPAKNNLVHLQNRTRLKGLPFKLVWHRETFYKKIDVSKGPPFNFFHILQRTGVSKSPKDPKSPFYIFRLCETFLNVIFRLQLWFYKWTSKLYSNFVFLQNLCFFGSMRFFHLALNEVPSTFTRNETCCQHRGLLMVIDCKRLFPKDKSTNF